MTPIPPIQWQLALALCARISASVSCNLSEEDAMTLLLCGLDRRGYTLN